MTIEIFLIELTACSLFTGLVTEAVKKILDSMEKTYNSNILAAICSVIVAAIVIVAFSVTAHITVTASYIVYCILLTIFSWLGAMVGYDKVIQTIQQIINK